MCDPDFNAWSNGKPNIVGKAGNRGRCAGGHIHIGYNNHNELTNQYLVKAMDLFLSVPLVIMEPENRRKEMYGKAGSYRNQCWGVEYRSTSNYIFSSTELMKWAFNQTLLAIKLVNENKGIENLDLYKGLILDSINNKDVKSAKRLIDIFSLEIITTKVVA